jgi:aminocarboxymuconate-semialdehyde decarboxylase
MAVIDTHAHFWPEATLDFIRAGEYTELSVEPGEGGLEWLVHSGGLRYPLSPDFFDLEAKVARMDSDGIEVALDSIPAPYFFYELAPEETLEISRTFNDAIAEHAAASGGRVRGVATVPLNDGELAAAELRRAREELGLVGVEIGTSLDATSLDAPEFEPLLATAEELRIPVMLHPYLSMLGERLPVGLDRFGLPVIFANLVESAAAAGRLILGGILDRHPELVVHLVHGGGYLPYQFGRLQRSWELNPMVSEVAERPPRDYLDNFVFDTIVYEPSALEFLIESVGAERVIFGTDLPFVIADLVALEAADSLDSVTRRLILEENPARVYGI